MIHTSSLLWKLTSEKAVGTYTSFLYGTMHSAGEPALTHFETLKKYLLSCSSYFGETDETGMQYLSRSVDNRFAWPGLEKIINKKAYAKAYRILKFRYQVDISRVDFLPPLMITSLISEHLMTSGTNSKILDQELWHFAKMNKLSLGGIESYHEQWEIFSKIPIDYQIAQLKDLLKNITYTRKKLIQLSHAYASNDLEKLYCLSKKSLGSMRNILLFDRNKRMAQRITNIVKNNTGNFVAVGAAHLPGLKGILRMLRNSGIKVEALPLL